MFVEIISSCVPHLLMIVRNGRYTTSLSVGINIISCSLFLVLYGASWYTSIVIYIVIFTLF